jgi:hypothetical protein
MATPGTGFERQNGVELLLLKFKASVASSTITQHIEQILPLHLQNNNYYFQGPVITLTFLNCILI